MIGISRLQPNIQSDLASPQDKSKKLVLAEASTSSGASASPQNRSALKNSGSSIKYQLRHWFCPSGAPERTAKPDEIYVQEYSREIDKSPITYEAGMQIWEQEMKNLGIPDFKIERIKLIFDRTKSNASIRIGSIPHVLLEVPYLPDVFQHFPDLEIIDFHGQETINSLPDSILHCKKLKSIGVNGGDQGCPIKI